MSQTFVQIHEILRYSHDKGHPVDIHTETNIYEDCDITSLSDVDATDGMVDFVALHTIKDCPHDFSFYLKQIRKVELV